MTPPRTAATQDRDLPAHPDPVLGREDEVDLVNDLLRAGARRLITLVGTGGVGKATLALVAAAAARSEFPGGVVMVELAGVSRGDDVVPKIRAALGVPEAAFDGTVASPATYLSGRRTLLVLDTVEHVLSCGPEIVGLVVSSPAAGARDGRRRASLELWGPMWVGWSPPSDEESSVHPPSERGDVRWRPSRPAAFPAAGEHGDDRPRRDPRVSR